mgnify:CR=1 FL=1
MILFLFACLAPHRTNLTGVVDRIGSQNCSIELSTGEVVVVESNICQKVKEGDVIYFYGARK